MKKRLSRRSLLALGLIALAFTWGGVMGVWTAAGDDVFPPEPIEGTETYGTSAPALADDPGVGETLIIVTTLDSFLSATDAGAFSDGLPFGDVQGFYVDRMDNYELINTYVETNQRFETVTAENGEVGLAFAPVHLALRPPITGCSIRCLYVAPPPDPCPGCVSSGQAAGDDPGEWILLSAFRTKTGAEEFMDLARAAGVENFAAIQVVKLAGGYVGLGQESHPDGSGPLLGPLPNQETYQA